MKRRNFIIALAVGAVIISVVLFLKITGGVIDVSSPLDKYLAPVFAKFNISEDDMARESRGTASRDGRRYLRVFREYSVRDVDFKKFTKALEAGLKKTPFTVKRSDYTSAKGREEAYYAIRFKALDVLSMRLAKKAGRRQKAPKKLYPNPKVAVVLDDFGNNRYNLEPLFSIGIPVTFSILPNLKYSSIISKEAAARGYEVILHLPLEPHRKDVVEEVDAINSGLPDDEVTARLRRDINSIPGLAGVSNHMGSKATEEPRLMEVIFRELKSRRLFFLDSFVTEKSVCGEVAKKVGIRMTRRSVFLDNRLDAEYIKNQLYAAKDLAFRTGACVAIGHDRKVTVRVLGEVLPELEKEGIRFVKLADLVQ